MSKLRLPTEAESQNRIAWMDSLKVICTFLIVMQHSISYSFTGLPMSSVQWKIIAVLFFLTRLAVPVFVMLSGIGMLSKERTLPQVLKRNILQLIKVYAAWMVIFGIKDVAAALFHTGGGTSVRVLFNMVLKSVLFGQYHTWFIYMLLGLYLVTPFLYCIVARSRQLAWAFLGISFLFTAILPLINYFPALSRLQPIVEGVSAPFFEGYVMLFLLGYLLQTEDIHVRYAIWIFWVIFGIAAVCSIGLSFKTGVPNHDIFAELSPVTVVLVTLMTLAFKDSARLGGLLKPGWSAYLVKFGIAIYLMHPMFLPLFRDKLGLRAVLFGALTWLASLMIACLLDRLAPLRKIFLR